MKTDSDELTPFPKPFTVFFPPSMQYLYSEIREFLDSRNLFEESKREHEDGTLEVEVVHITE